MKTYYGNYLGIVINNNDPEYRGRVQVFIPHIMPTLYEGWNRKGENITINCVGDNMPQGLTSDIIEKLKKILPWSEAASPIVGQSSPGSVSSAFAGAMASSASLGSRVEPVSVGGASGALPDSNNSTAPSSSPTGGLHLDQSPTAIPAGSLPPGTSLKIPTQGSWVDVKNLKPLFIQRLNGFYEEANKLGYKITCTSGFRSFEKQAALFKQIGRPGCAPPGGSSHEYGVAADFYITGPGVSITEIKVEASRSGKNYDTPEFRSLLAKYSLHQPLHPIHRPSGPEHWHIEPVEIPAAGGARGIEANKRVAALMSQTATNTVAENTSSSQFPPAANPLENKSPSNTSMATPTSPTTT